MSKYIEFEVIKTGRIIEINATINWNSKVKKIPLLTYYNGNDLVFDSTYWDEYLDNYLHNKIKKTKFNHNVPFKYNGSLFSFNTCTTHKRYSDTYYTISVNKCDRGIIVDELKKLKTQIKECLNSK